MNLKKEKAIATLAANKACKIMMQYFGKNHFIKEKSDKSFVSNVDLKVNEAIIGIIKKSFPDHNTLSEESGLDIKKSDYKWIIDPIDGTHNFLHNIPIFGTSIALAYKNKVVLGVIALPALQLIAIAEKGKGAFLNGKKIKVSNKKGLNHSFLFFEFFYNNRKEKIDFLEKLSDNPIDVRNFGSAIYHLLLVASGRSDAYIILYTKEWDVAAGFLIVQEAGGTITELESRGSKVNEKKYIVSNGKIYEKILGLLKNYQSKNYQNNGNQR